MPRSDFVKETKLYNHCNSSPHTKISTNYMVQDFPSMVHNYSAGQGILFLLNPRDQYCVCRSPTFDPIPSQFNSVHIFHTISLRFILMLPSHLCFGVPSGLFLWGSTSNTSYIKTYGTLKCTTLTTSVVSFSLLSTRLFAEQQLSTLLWMMLVPSNETGKTLRLPFLY